MFSSSLDKNFSRIQVEGDSKLVIHYINKKCLILWRLKSIIKDILSITSKFEVIIFQRIFRKANFITDTVTSIGHRISSSQTWINALPAFNHVSFGLVALGASSCSFLFVVVSFLSLKKNVF